MYGNSYGNKTKKYLSIFTFSGMEILGNITIASLLLILHYVKVIQEYLGLPRDFEFSSIIKNGMDTLLNSTLGQGRTEAFVVGFFWALVGLAVYVFLKGIAKAMFDLGDGIDQRGYVWPKGSNRYGPLKQAAERAGFQFVIFIVIVIWLLQPLARLMDGPVFVDVIGGSSVMLYSVWFAMTFVALHVLVVLVRLLLLKPRLFN